METDRLPCCDKEECIEFDPKCDAEGDCEHGKSCWCTNCDKARCSHEEACRRAYEMGINDAAWTRTEAEAALAKANSNQSDHGGDDNEKVRDLAGKE